MKENLLNLTTFKFEFPNSLRILLYPRFFTYNPQLNISIETSRYLLKTAETFDELIQVFKLRQEIFLGHQEEPKNKNTLDIDHLDHRCDHIVIIDKRTDRVCGTYRIISSEKVSSFYSESEFHMDEFLKDSGTKVELGRACIDKAHRNGVVIDLLWKGIAKYCEELKADYLFGCSSIHTNELSHLKSLDFYLKSMGHLSTDFSIRSRDEFRVRAPELEEDSLKHVDDLEWGKSFLPPLLNSYLKAGARVYGDFAYDEDFQCFDYLTILRLKDVSSAFKRRYFSYLSLS